MGRHGLSARRQDLGFTQEALAEVLRVAVSTVARWERGEATPSARYRRAYASALGLAVSDLECLLRGGTSSGGTDPVADLVNHLERATRAAAEDRRPHTLRLLGHAHQAMGDLAFDQLRLGEATDHFHHAHELSIEVGDADLASGARVQLGDVARRRGRYHAAIHVLRSAERDAAAASVLVQVRRAQTLARVYAESGDRAGFDRTIGRAEHLAGRVPAAHHQSGDHSPRGVRFERAQGLTLLGQPRKALAIYEESRPTSFRSSRDRGNFVIIHAQALAHAGHLDEGVRLAVEGVRLARSYRSARHVSRVQRMYDRLVTVSPGSERRLGELREALAS